MSTAKGLIWFRNDQVGVPDLEAEGFQRFETSDYAVVFRSGDKGSFAIRVREPDAPDDVPERWKRVHNVPFEEVKSTQVTFAGIEGVCHEAPCEESDYLRTIVVRTPNFILDIGQLASKDLDHAGLFASFTARIQLR